MRLPPQAYVVLGLFALALISVVVFTVVQWRGELPKAEVSGFGVRWSADAIQPWPGFAEALARVRLVLSTMEPAIAPSVLSMWIDVIGPGGKVTSNLAPTGTITTGDGVAHGVNGTIDGIRAYDVGPRQMIVRIRQLRTGSGALADARTSALYHEVAQHLLPLLSGRGLNFDHSDVRSAEIERVMNQP